MLFLDCINQYELIFAVIFIKMLISLWRGCCLDLYDMVLLELQYQLELYLQANRLNPEEFSKRTSIPIHTIFRVLERQVVSLAELQMICGALNIPVESLTNPHKDEEFNETFPKLLEITFSKKCDRAMKIQKLLNSLDNVAKKKMLRHLAWLLYFIDNPDKKKNKESLPPMLFAAFTKPIDYEITYNTIAENLKKEREKLE